MVVFIPNFRRLSQSQAAMEATEKAEFNLSMEEAAVSGGGFPRES